MKAINKLRLLFAALLLAGCAGQAQPAAAPTTNAVPANRECRAHGRANRAAGRHAAADA